MIRYHQNMAKNFRSYLTGFIVFSSFALAASNSLAKEIKFSDIYNAPDNAQLNLDYANQEIANGNLLSAASALERILLSQPNLDSTRLLYAKVLLWLDDTTGSKRELDLLKTRNLTAENSKTFKVLQKEVKKRLAKTKQ